MPLFAYTCKACEATSELLIRADEEPECPACGSKKMEKQMSQITPMSGSGGGAVPEGCGGCCNAGGGGCPRAS